MFEQAFCDCGEGKNKHTRIPAITSIVQVFEGTIKVWLFNKTMSDMERRFVRLAIFWCRQNFPHFDVAISCFWPCWRNSNGNNGLGKTGHVIAFFQYLLEFLFTLLRNQMISGKNRHGGGCTACTNHCSGKCDGRAGIPTARFGYNVILGNFRQLLPNRLSLGFAGDNINILHWEKRPHPFNGMLKKRFFIEKSQ